MKFLIGVLNNLAPKYELKKILKDVTFCILFLEYVGYFKNSGPRLKNNKEIHFSLLFQPGKGVISISKFFGSE